MTVLSGYDPVPQRLLQNTLTIKKYLDEEKRPGALTETFFLVLGPALHKNGTARQLLYHECVIFCILLTVFTSRFFDTPWICLTRENSFDFRDLHQKQFTFTFIFFEKKNKIFYWRNPMNATLRPSYQ